MEVVTRYSRYLGGVAAREPAEKGHRVEAPRKLTVISALVTSYGRLGYWLVGPQCAVLPCGLYDGLIGSGCCRDPITASFLKH